MVQIEKTQELIERYDSSHLNARSAPSVFIVKPADVVFSQIAAGLDLN